MREHAARTSCDENAVSERGLESGIIPVVGVVFYESVDHIMLGKKTTESSNCRPSVSSSDLAVATRNVR